MTEQSPGTDGDETPATEAGSDRPTDDAPADDAPTETDAETPDTGPDDAETAATDPMETDTTTVDATGADDAPSDDDDESAADGEAADDDEPAAADESAAAADESAAATEPTATPGVPDDETLDVPEDVATYDRFSKMDGAQYERVNEFLRDRTYITAREWAIARLCSDFRTETGVEMTKIGENLPELVPFMTDTYTPQAVNQARAAFEDKIRTAGATFLYGAMCDFFTAEELDDVMYESTEVAKFLLEVEGVDLSVEEELEAEERISSVMREVREASAELREEEETE